MPNQPWLDWKPAKRIDRPIKGDFGDDLGESLKYDVSLSALSTTQRFNKRNFPFLVTGFSYLFVFNRLQYLNFLRKKMTGN